MRPLRLRRPDATDLAELPADPELVEDVPVQELPRGNAFEVFRVATRLGLTSFGGPIAHLGYFRTEYVQRRRWLDERT